MKPVLQVFARAPLPGHCKTRMIPALGAAGAARLQMNLVHHTLATAAAWRARVPGAAVQLWCAPDRSDGFFTQCAREHDLELFDQDAGDLGARMWLALMHALRHGALPVLIGTDCPWLDAGAIVSLHAALAKHDSAFVAAEDGGYVAVGLARAVPELFAGVSWGSAQVMRETRERAQRADATLVQTGSRPDIDVPADLARLRADARLARLVPEYAD